METDAWVQLQVTEHPINVMKTHFLEWLLKKQFINYTKSINNLYTKLCRLEKNTQ